MILVPICSWNALSVGCGAVLFITINVMGLMTVVNSLNGKKSLKATHATIGYDEKIGLITDFIFSHNLLLLPCYNPYILGRGNCFFYMGLER